MRLYKKACLALVALTLCAMLPCANAAAAQKPAEAAFIYRETPFKRNASFGVMDVSGRAVIPAQYDIAQAFSNGYFCLGNEAPQPEIDYAWKDQTVALFSPRGSRLTGFDYYEINMLADDVFVGYTKNDTHIISPDGKIPYKVSFSAYVYKTHAGYAIFESDYNLPERRLKLISSNYETLHERMCENGYVTDDKAILFTQNKFSGIISAEGEVTVEPTTYNNISEIGGGYYSFNDGGALYGIMNAKGKVVVPAIYSNISGFYGDVFGAYKDKELFILDEEGNELHSDTNCYVQLVYDNEEGLPVLISKNSGASWYLLWRDGRIYKGDSLFNYSYMRGNKLFLTKTTNYMSRENGIIRIHDLETGENVDIEGKSVGIINENAIDVGFADADGNWQTKLYDMQGRPLADGAAFTHAFNANWEEGGAILVSKPAKLPASFLYGLLNQDGTWLLPCRFNQLSYVAPGVYSAKAGSRVGYINEAGEWIYSAAAYFLLDD